ncbi:MAG: twin-arginine translocase TatA/TatE family subunit [Bdellovibrionota bacterium]|nr:MAG: twin-arginine translocase TatA/TatE family subunit [Bdellovibrionota bacterium]
MFGIGLWELVLIFLVMLLAFGPDKLPDLARTLGRLSGELRRNSDALRREFYQAVYAPTKESSGELEQLKRDLNAVRSLARPNLIGTCEESRMQSVPSNQTGTPSEPKATEQADEPAPPMTSEVQPAQESTVKPKTDP